MPMRGAVTRRVLLLTDMEGVSWLTDRREIWPVFARYRRSGQQRLTADSRAAASGLLDGGAAEVVVRDGHGFGIWPNIVAEDLPDRAPLVAGPIAPEEFDDAFQVGFHARCGTRDGFLAHTRSPASPSRSTVCRSPSATARSWRSAATTRGRPGGERAQIVLSGHNREEPGSRAVEVILLRPEDVVVRPLLAGTVWKTGRT
jgi:D-aminopeptidase